jgi:hypothetical protein
MIHAYSIMKKKFKNSNAILCLHNIYLTLGSISKKNYFYFYFQFCGFESLEKIPNLVAIFLEFMIILKNSPKKYSHSARIHPEEKTKKHYSLNFEMNFCETMKLRC